MTGTDTTTEAGRSDERPASGVPGARVDRPGGRSAALDGLRGIVVVTVVLNHAGGLLWPRGAAYDVPVLSGFLGGGAVVVFFVLGGFLVTLGLLREQAEGRLDAWRFALRRVVRLLPQLLLLCVALALALRFDPVPADPAVVASNVAHVLTFTSNTFAAEDLLQVRPELGHLWYLGVQQQCYLLLPLLLLLLAGRRWGRPVLLVALVVGVVAVYLERERVLDEQGWIVASVLTTTRSDGLLWGVALALLVTRLQPSRGVRAWSAVLAVAAVALLVLQSLLPTLPPLSFLGWWSLAFTLTSGVLVLAVWLARPGALVARALAVAPLRVLGRASYSIYLWHLPIVLVLTRHTPDWRWQARTLLALAVLAVVVVAAERLLEDPVRRLLARHPLFRIPPDRTPVAEGER